MAGTPARVMAPGVAPAFRSIATLARGAVPRVAAEPAAPFWNNPTSRSMPLLTVRPTRARGAAPRVKTPPSCTRLAPPGVTGAQPARPATVKVSPTARPRAWVPLGPVRSSTRWVAVLRAAFFTSW